MTAFTLNLIGISKCYLTSTGAIRTVLDRLSLTVKSHEIVCLLGPSGCGKTTLLKILARIEAPDQGKLESQPSSIPPTVSYMPQGDSLLPWRTVGANIRLGLELRGCRTVAAEGRVAGLLASVQLSEKCRDYPRELSGGMRRRAALARTLAVESDLLLLDEPLTNLDSVARHELAAIIRTETVRTGVAAVIVTHSIEEAANLADRIVVLRGSPAEVIEDFARSPASPGESLAHRDLDSGLYHRIIRALGNGVNL